MRFSLPKRSLIADPNGEVLHQASQSQAEAMIVDINPAEAEDKTMTRRNDAFADRRPDCYGELLADEAAPS